MVQVLLVDDDARVRTACRMMLEGAGFEVAEAADGAAGVAAYHAHPADVVLCDVFMPGTDGLELIQQLRREFPGVKIIAMSGGSFNGALGLLPVAHRLGAAEVLAKPFDQATALAALRRVLASPSAG